MGSCKSALRRMEEACGIPVRGNDGREVLLKRKCLTHRLGFDRDLSIAGRVMVKTKDGSLSQRLVKIDRPSQSPLTLMSNLY